MSQTAGLIDTTIGNFFDYVIFAGHKTLYAPTGIAGFVLKNQIILKLLFLEERELILQI